MSKKLFRIRVTVKLGLGLGSALVLVCLHRQTSISTTINNNTITRSEKRVTITRMYAVKRQSSKSRDILCRVTVIYQCPYSSSTPFNVAYPYH